MSSWFAIRTSPGAQMPQREYQVETTELNAVRPRGKGYRIVGSLNPKMSAVERALNDIGVQHYMPAEFKVIRNRKKTGTYELRRFALLPGYVFVYNVTDWLTLREAPGVAGIVGIDGVPLKISIVDIIALRSFEAKSQAKADKEVVAMNSAVKAEAVKGAQKALSLAKRRFSAGQSLKIMWGSHAGRNATLEKWDGNNLRVLVETLDASETVSVGYDEVKLVA
ncbi:transcription termination/antitermination protein NusG [Mesorhizobium sp. Root172]|uniref:transcription termination/antitermination protein NusG n=1 Tax=Mesorhizobium sp. Root172 TaxID=1736481 RepID=UPI0009EC703F|nr:transcription termination/antitermination NusG family protein [Mesorhizobium sp. Root172]